MTRLVILAAAAIVTAGCASAGASGPGAPDGAASIVPSNAIAFVAASTDLDSSQWHSIGKAFLKQYESFKPALGDEVDIAVLPGKQVVALTQPHDAQKLAALARKYDARTRTIGGWTAIAKTDAELDTVVNATTHLAQNTAFAAAMNRLPQNALVRAYASGAEAETLIASIPGQREGTFVRGGGRFRSSQGASGYRWGAADVTSTDAGLKLEAFASIRDLSTSGPPRFSVRQIAPYQAVLVDEIPAGALAVADFQVPLAAFHLVPKLPPPLLQLFDPAKIGASSVTSELDTLLGGETAVYLRPALPLPEVTIVTQPRDTGQAAKALDDLLAATRTPVTVYRDVLGGQFVISTTERGIQDFRSGGAKLSADPAFLEAKQQAAMPDQTTGFVYANLKAVAPLLQLAGVTLPAGLPALGTFLAYGDRTATESTFQAFIGLANG